MAKGRSETTAICEWGDSGSSLHQNRLNAMTLLCRTAQVITSNKSMQKSRIVVMIGFFLLPIVLSGLGGYGFISLKAKRSLSTSEMLYYTGIVASNTAETVLFHRNGSGFKTFGIIADAISDRAIAQTTLVVGQEKQVLPLPPHTILASCDRISAYILPLELEADATTNPYGLEVPYSCKVGAAYPREIKFFLTLTPLSQMEPYFTTTLPNQGWSFERDHPGAASTFRKGNLRILLQKSPYFGAEISLLILRRINDVRLT